MSQSLRHTVTVFVVESSPISGQLLAEAIARGSGIEVLGYSSNPREVSQALYHSLPEVLVVSARIEEESTGGVSLLKELHSQYSSLKAIVLLDSSRPEVVVEAFRSGASGVFCRSTNIHLLRKCIFAVHSGQVWASSAELGFVLSALAAGHPLQFESKQIALLSAREKQVIQCLVVGLTNKEIADLLLISQHTVKNYIFKIFDKLGVSNRIELAFHILSGNRDVRTIFGALDENPPGEKNGGALLKAVRPESQRPVPVSVRQQDLLNTASSGDGKAVSKSAG